MDRANVAPKNNGITFSLNALAEAKHMAKQHLSGAAMQMLLIIQQTPETSGWHEISQQEMSDLSERHRSTVGRVIRQLKELGYIETDTNVSRGWHRKQRYRVVKA